MKAPREQMPNGQIPIFSNEELDAVAKAPEVKPVVQEKSKLGPTPDEIENLYKDNDEDRKKYWNR